MTAFVLFAGGTMAAGTLNELRNELRKILLINRGEKIVP